jgi:hypothetical protein
MNAETLLVDMKTAARILGIPFTAVHRLIAEDRILAIQAGRAGEPMITRTISSDLRSVSDESLRAKTDAFGPWYSAGFF